MKKKKRFSALLSESSGLDNIKVICDSETGVCYMLTTSGYGCACTPLLNADGSLKVATISEIEGK